MDSGKVTIRIIAAAVLAILAIHALPARAHHLIREKTDTRGPDSALAIPRPEISWAVYARLEGPDDVDFVSFRLEQPGVVHLGIFIPCRPEFADYYPAYALVGPGLDAPAEPIPFDLAPGHGAVVVRSRPALKRETFYEPFTLTLLYRGVTFTDTRVDRPGEYFMAVWSDRGDYGDYLVSYGTAESWSARELLDAYKVVFEVKSGAWGKFRGRP